MLPCPKSWDGVPASLILQALHQQPDYCTVCDCPLKVDGVQLANMSYRPSLAGNALFTAIFAVLLIIQIALGIRYKTKGFAIAMACGLIMEIVGYIGRILMRNHMFEFSYFVMYVFSALFICSPN